MSNVQTKKHSLIKLSLAISLAASSAACLPELEVPQQVDSGADTSGGDSDTSLPDATPDASPDAEIDAGCPDAPPECVAFELGPRCSESGAPVECVADANGCVTFVELGGCDDDSYCNDGECVLCMSAPGCGDVGDTACTRDGDLGVCQRDSDGCFVLEDIQACDSQQYCERGQCVSCDDLGAACTSNDALRCADQGDGSGGASGDPTRLREQCVMRNGCMVFAEDASLECPAGELCEPGGACETCNDALCTEPGIMSGDATRCLPANGPRAIERCVENEYACFEQAAEECPADTFCLEAGSPAEARCESCDTLPDDTCASEGATRCEPPMAGSSASVQVCEKDMATGCLVWRESSDCENGTDDGVCVSSGQRTDPNDASSTVAQPTCALHLCDGIGDQRCTGDGAAVLRCNRQSSTGLRFETQLLTCSTNQVCTVETGVGVCECSNECVDGVQTCSPAGSPEICDTDANGCTFKRLETENPCVDRLEDDGVACTASSPTKIDRCVDVGGCLRPDTVDCACSGPLVAGVCTLGRLECEPGTPYPGGQPQSVCQ